MKTDDRSALMDAAALLLAPTEDRLEDSGRLGSYLHEMGWLRSLETRRADPLPWMTYAAIEFLDRRVPKGLSIFEYGAGSSTAWWVSHGSHVVSCDDNSDWVERARQLAPGATVVLRNLADGSYAREVAAHGPVFDIVVIDGRERVACARNAPRGLNARGLILFDNADRRDYDAAYAFLQESGFRRLDFYGMGPVNPYGWCTSIFYRDANCLGI